MKQYKAKCHTCGKILKDPNPDGPDPIYDVVNDIYYCDDKCKDKDNG